MSDYELGYAAGRGGYDFDENKSDSWASGWHDGASEREDDLAELDYDFEC